MTHKDLYKKKKTPYKEGNSEFIKAVKDVDLNKRTVTGMFNTFFYIDSDKDMLLPGCCAKSIADRGPKTSGGNKIKHLKDHDWTKAIARLEVLEERTVNYKGQNITGIYHESFYPEQIQESNDTLIQIQEKIIDDRSIGFVYKDLQIADKNSDNEQEVKNWNQYFPLALNPEDAKDEWFWVVKEIMLFEGSDISFLGASRMTPTLDVKSGSKLDKVDDLMQRIKSMNNLYRNGNLSDEASQRLHMEELQLKQYICNILDNEPSLKDNINAKNMHRSNDIQAKRKNYLINYLKR